MSQLKIMARFNTFTKARKAEVLTVLYNALNKLDRAVKAIKAEFVQDYRSQKASAPNLERLVIGEDCNRWQVKGKEGVVLHLTNNDVIKLLGLPTVTEVVNTGSKADDNKSVHIRVSISTKDLRSLRANIQNGELSQAKAILHGKADIVADQTIEVRKIK